MANDNGAPLGSGVVKVAFKWWHYAGGIGTLLAVLALLFSIWQWEDEKKHDIEIMEEQKQAWNDAAEAGKSDVTINLDLPDVNVDETVEAIGNKITEGRKDVAELSGAVAGAIGDTTRATTETVAKYWKEKKDIFALPSVFGGGDDPTEEEIRICDDADMSDWLPPELWDDMCG